MQQYGAPPPAPPGPPSYTPPPGYTPPPSAGGHPNWALGLGIGSLFAWFIPFIGYPVAIVGLVFSAKGLKTGNGRFVAGLVTAIIGLLLTIVNSALGVYLALHK